LFDPLGFAAPVVLAARCLVQDLWKPNLGWDDDVFLDASEVGYGSSSYLRVEYPDGRVHCTFVLGKARNAPVKFVGIPRLELQAAVLATRKE
jgi:hypothetical protein